ncbi:MAG: helix-turn-helix domain-containing protein [Taibaiella sp.]|nr:helix-turn-helix domain-containing protein [Taibaiella sp.]
MHRLTPVRTTPIEKLSTEIEQKTTYALDRCELNIFETHRKADNVKLTFGGFTVTSMLRGKKVLKSGRREGGLVYLPGETFILPPEEEMVIDFPEADYTNPTQCTALVIEQEYLKRQLEYINDNFPKERELNSSWDLRLDESWLQNDEHIAHLGNKIISIFSGNDPLKDILVDLKLKELMLSIMRLQNYRQLGVQNVGERINERFRAVVEYIRCNITSEINARELSRMACMSKSVFYRAFVSEFGVPPRQMILAEKIRYAKSMMASQRTPIKEICFALGFSDPNYFSRAFRKIEGISPTTYLAHLQSGAA